MRDKIIHISTFIIGLIYLIILSFCLPHLCYGMDIQEDREKHNYISYKPLVDEEKQIEKDILEKTVFYRIKALKWGGKAAYGIFGFAVGCIILSYDINSSAEGLQIIKRAAAPLIGTGIGIIAGEAHSEWIDWMMNK